MAISSAIRPEVITNKRNLNPIKAQNFISGKTSSDVRTFGSAANKIVKFQRAGVQPSSVDINSIIKTLSTGIVNNYNNQAQTINNSVTNIINKTIGNLSKDYQDKIKKVDEAKPTGVLQKVLGLYKDVINFIQFFGRRKFVDGLRDNLKALQTSFSESFEVAKLIRQVIIKIVKQLSNLPKASPSGGGGINLDVDVPGNKLKGSNTPLNRRMRGGMGKGKMLALGAGALGLGVAGAAATNALSDSDAIQPKSSTPEIPGNIVDSLSVIINRFASAIDRLIKGSSDKKSSGSSASSSRGASSASPGASPGAPGDPGETPSSPVVSSAPVDEKLAAYTSVLEGTAGQNAADAMQVMLNRAVQNHGKFGGLGEQVMAEGQFTPMAAAIYGTSGDPAANRAYGHIAPMLGKTPAERKAKLRQIVETEGMKGLDKLYNKKFAGEANKVLADFKSGGPLSRNAAQGVKGRVYFKGQTDLHNMKPGDFYRYTGGNYFHTLNPEEIKGKIGTLQQINPATVTPQTTQAVAQQRQQQIAQVSQAVAQQRQQQIAQVSQPVQTQPQVNYIPIDMSGGGKQTQQSSSSGEGISAPPPTSQSGPTVPFLSSSNSDNFLVLYSRMIYNLVDG
jgi:hypothetical protein